MKPRILYGGLFHETHTFLTEPTRWVDFAVTRGADILAKAGDESPVAGFLEEARRLGWEVQPTVDARAMPGGPVEDEAFEHYWTEFAQRARPALAAGADAIFLVLHGAMATAAIEDVEGELLARVRALPGAAQLPLFGVLDLHGNMTARMCALANGLVAYRKNPHTDAKATAVRAAGLLQRCLVSGRVPRMNWCRVPVLWAPPGTGTHSEPMRSLTEWAARTETEDPALWACNVMAAFSFADTAESGVTLSTVSDAVVERMRPHHPARATSRRFPTAGCAIPFPARAAGRAPVYLLMSLAIEYPKNHDTPASPLPFSPAVRVGDFIFVSGQASVDDAGALVPDTFEGEFRRSVENLRKVLESAGSDLRHVVQTRNYVRDPANVASTGRISRRRIPRAPRSRTACPRRCTSRSNASPVVKTGRACPPILT
jgi:enamine deaminase RidA (YjgF/YER057c/UK114 family)